jgi:hypothetical protein
MTKLQYIMYRNIVARQIFPYIFPNGQTNFKTILSIFGTDTVINIQSIARNLEKMRRQNIVTKV